jgi:uncharacterized protein (TIGR03067 family)
MFPPQIVALFVTGSLIAAEPPKDAVKEELAKLQGTWKVERVEAGGKEVKDLKLGEITFKEGGGVEGLGPDITVKLDPTRKPKEIDLIRGKDGRPWMGIYSLDGDTLKLSLALVEAGKVAEQKRPTDFDKEKPQMIITLKKAKP